MPDEKLIFQPVIEAMFVAGLKDRMTDPFRARLKVLGIAVEKIRPAYPYEIWENALLEAVTLFPELQKGEALEELGRRLVSATIDAHPVGKTLLPMLRVLGISRAIKRTLKNGASENFNVATFGAETSTSLVVHMSDVGRIPEYAMGTLAGLAGHVGAKNVRATIESYTPPTATYLLEWS